MTGALVAHLAKTLRIEPWALELEPTERHLVFELTRAAQLKTPTSARALSKLTHTHTRKLPPLMARLGMEWRLDNGAKIIAPIPRAPKVTDSQAQLDRQIDAFLAAYPCLKPDSNGKWDKSERVIRQELMKRKNARAFKEFDLFMSVTAAYIQAVRDNRESPIYQRYPWYFVRKGQDEPWLGFEHLVTETSAAPACPHCRDGYIVVNGEVKGKCHAC